PFADPAAARSIERPNLTDRQRQILKLVAEGKSNKEIARALDISPNTVKTHIANVFQKLEVQRRTQAIQKARELRLIP
ncbi:MAG: response regulator transcription factor, partial [Aestuariivirga sp.]